MYPSLWNRVNLDSLDHMTLFHWSSIPSLCSLANWSLFFQLASLISGFLKATQLFQSLEFSSHCAWKNAPTFTIKYSCEFYCWFIRICFHQTLKLSLITIFLKDNGSPPSFEVLITCQPILFFVNNFLLLLNINMYSSPETVQVHCNHVGEKKRKRKRKKKIWRRTPSGDARLKDTCFPTS